MPDQEVVTLDGAETRGDLLRPGDAAYEDARRVWNGMIDRRPALIARCGSLEPKSSIAESRTDVIRPTV